MFYFNASDVAALLGKNKYKPKEAALLSYLHMAVVQEPHKFPADLCTTMRTNSTILEALQQVTKHKICKAYMPGAMVAVAEAARERRDVTVEAIEKLAADANEQRQVVLAHAAEQQVRSATAAANAHVASAPAVAAADIVREHMIQRVLSEDPTVKMVPVAIAREARTAMENNTATPQQTQLLASIASTREHAAKAEHVVQAVQAAASAEAVRQARDSQAAAQAAAQASAEAATLATISDQRAMESLLRSEVHKKRGRDEERAVLDDVEKRKRMTITMRNVEMRYFRCEQYIIGGRCDGQLENGTIVELKTRRHWFSKPPEYDLLQLQIYLKIFNEPHGELIEKQQTSDRSRETPVTCPEHEWAIIHEGLVATVRVLAEMTAEGALQLATVLLRDKIL